MNKTLLLPLLPALLLYPPRSVALDGPGLTNGVRAVRSILDAQGRQEDEMRILVRRYGWTPDDCTEILLALEADLRPRRTDYHSSFCHEVTFSLMADFASTNALPTLAEMLWDRTLPEHFGPRTAYVRISRCAPQFMEPLVRRIDANVVSNDLFAYYCYEDVRWTLQRWPYPPEERQQLVDFLVRRVGEDARNAGLLDDILCKEVPAWRESPQRLERAQSLLRLHPDAPARSAMAGITNRLRRLSPAVRASPPRLVPSPVQRTDPKLPRAIP